MTIRYTITRKDLLVANFRTLIRNRFLQVVWAVIICSSCYSALHEPKMLGYGLAYKIGFCLFFGAIYFAALFGLTFVVTSAMLLVRKNKGVLGEHRLTISDEGLIESTIYNESLNRWSAYHKTISTSGYLLLYVSEVHFHFISKKRPLLEGDLAAFESLLNAKVKSPNP